MKLLLVKGQFRTFQDVSIATSCLSWSGCDLGIQSSGSKLGIQDGFQGLFGRSLFEFGLNLLGHGRGINLFDFGRSSSLLDTNLDSVVGFVPCLEGMSINQDNRSLDQGLGTDQFVIGGVVRDVQDTDLAGADFGTPGKVSGIQAQGTVFDIATTAADLADPGFTNLGHGRRPAHFKLSLLSELGPTASRFTTLVASFACNTHGD
mmetsp:Transcript_106863/g.297338  ORF Transcript_106863/g.297338 Transcript_106863/m.297338 type:complete len:205 (-) Transcript_106863:19-633(-)